MRIVSTGYSKSPEHSEPHAWLDRIAFYTGILSELAKKHEVTSIERIDYVGDTSHQGVHYHFISQARRIARFPLGMHRYIGSLRPDVVLVNGINFPLQIAQLSRRLGRRARILVLHRAERPLMGIRRRLQRWADKDVDAYLFASREFADDWRNNIDTNKLFEVLQASSIFHRENKEESRQRLGIGPGPVFLWVGRLNANKDPVSVVTAFRQFADQYREARLYMVFQTEELLASMKEVTAPTPFIRLIGKVPHSQLQDWYNAADFFVSGSHYEGGGTAVVEAMSCGCIPILTDIIPFRKFTGPAACGMLYEKGNEQDLLNKLVQASYMNIDMESEKVLKQFERELSFQAIAKKIEDIIESLPTHHED